MSDSAHVARAYYPGPFGQMHLRHAGVPSARPAVICFHMSPMSGRIYETFLGELGRDRQVIAPDTPGYGQSDPPPAQPTITDYAGAMAHLIETMGLSAPVDLFGYHTGSLIAPELALLRPDLVRRIVMVSAPLFTAQERDYLERTYHPEPPRADGGHLLGLWQSMVHWHLHSGATLEHIEDQFPDKLLGRGRAGWGHRAAFDYDLDGCLPRIAQPILVLNPRDDIWAQTPRARERLQNGRIVDLPGWGHGFLTRGAADAAGLVRQFFDAPDNAPFDHLSAPADALVARSLPNYPRGTAGPD